MCLKTIATEFAVGSTPVFDAAMKSAAPIPAVWS